MDDTSKMKHNKTDANEGTCASYYHKYPITIVLLDTTNDKVSKWHHKIEGDILDFGSFAFCVYEKINQPEITQEPNSQIDKQD